MKSLGLLSLSWLLAAIAWYLAGVMQMITNLTLLTELLNGAEVSSTSNKVGGSAGCSADAPRTNSISRPSRQACQCTTGKPVDISLTRRFVFRPSWVIWLRCGSRFQSDSYSISAGLAILPKIQTDETGWIFLIHKGKRHFLLWWMEKQVNQSSSYVFWNWGNPFHDETSPWHSLICWEFTGQVTPEGLIFTCMELKPTRNPWNEDVILEITTKLARDKLFPSILQCCTWYDRNSRKGSQMEGTWVLT